MDIGQYHDEQYGQKLLNATHRLVPQARVNTDAIWEREVYALKTLFCSHIFCRWIHNFHLPIDGFLATLVAVYFTPISHSLGGSVGQLHSFKLPKLRGLRACSLYK